MIGRRALRGLACVALAMPAGVRAAPVERVYVVERLGDAIGADDAIGPKRAGLACLPGGKLRWRDLAPSGVADRREIVEDALQDAGLPIATLGSGAGAQRQWRVRGLVTEATANFCARQQVFGDRSALSGTAHLVIEWRIEDGATLGGAIKHVSTVDRTFAPKQPASATVIGRALIGDAARDLAGWLKSGAAATK